jgi:hypothetical protein
MDQVAVLRPEVAAVYRSDRARFDETAAEWTREYAVKAGGSARWELDPVASAHPTSAVLYTYIGRRLSTVKC